MPILNGILFLLGNIHVCLIFKYGSTLSLINYNDSRTRNAFIANKMTKVGLWNFWSMTFFVIHSMDFKSVKWGNVINKYIALGTGIREDQIHVLIPHCFLLIKIFSRSLYGILWAKIVSINSWYKVLWEYQLTIYTVLYCTWLKAEVSRLVMETDQTRETQYVSLRLSA